NAFAKNLELNVAFETPIPREIVGDPVRARQVVTNLVGNAIKFTESGEVLVRVDVIDQTGDEAALRFSVADTGIGIPPDRIEAIFNAFEQADNSTTRQFGGTGLGLAISRRLVELLGGAISVESEVNYGSTFSFTIPLRVVRASEGAQQDSRRGQALPSELRELQVLLVDDNDTSRGILREMIASWGFECFEADSAEAACELLRRTDRDRSCPTLALIDVLMPGTDGFALAKRIQTDWPAIGCVMLLSAGHQDCNLSRCDRLGLRWHLLKPPQPSELLETILNAWGCDEPIGGESPAAAMLFPEPSRPLRVLLAEDSPVNQKLAVGLLTRAGHRVTLAGNGREALEQLRNASFDLVLMDVQMPEIDGLQATAAIRADEARRNGHGRTPIVAMTAHAMAGDRERCLAAGMDGYLSKPIRAHTLLATIQEVMAQFPATKVEDSTADETHDFDWSTALNVVQGDQDLLRELVDAFLTECPRLMQEIEVALEQNDAEQLRIAAHTLKGSVRYFGAEAAMSVAFDLELAGKEGRFSGVDGKLAQLQDELNRLLPPLMSFAKTGQLA
ncbi:MAG: response regulator, partial [Planctomycetales bacterium]|nr:response regulator [Planctomycetales bacterium]